MSERADYLFDPSAVTRAEDPPEDTVRLFWLFIVLVRERAVSYAQYAALFARTERTFKRDLAKLRDLGERYGFALTRRRAGEIRLVRFERDPLERRARAESNDFADTLLAVVDALGDVVAKSLERSLDASAFSADRFLRIGMPRARIAGDAGIAYEVLRSAWRDRARVRFRYSSRDASVLSERVVEPYATTCTAGRYYLIGFDTRPRSGGWRQYALDRIVGSVKRAGTFTPRVLPDEYRGEDAVGFFKTGRAYEVTVAVSSTIEAAVTARSWQRRQRLGRDESGRQTITFTAFDIDEVVRWTLGFGVEAEVIAPPAAVERAGEIARELARRYLGPANALAAERSA